MRVLACVCARVLCRARVQASAANFFTFFAVLAMFQIISEVGGRAGGCGTAWIVRWPSSVAVRLPINRRCHLERACLWGPHGGSSWWLQLGCWSRCRPQAIAPPPRNPPPQGIGVCCAVVTRQATYGIILLTFVILVLLSFSGFLMASVRTCTVVVMMIVMASAWLRPTGALPPPPSPLPPRPTPPRHRLGGEAVHHVCRS